MSKKVPKHGDLLALETFLDACEKAAIPWTKGMRDDVLSPRMTTLEDVLWLSRKHGNVAPFETNKVLGNDRAQRLVTLHEWLRLLPAFAWLHDTPEVKTAMTAFRRLQKAKRREGSLFADDLAEFRFWRFAFYAVCVSLTSTRPEPDFKQRTDARNAARVLQKIVGETALLTVALSSSRRSGPLMLCLAEIEAFATKAGRRTRADATKSAFVRQLVEKATEIFGDSPNTVVAALAGLSMPGVAAGTRLGYAKDAKRSAKEG